jgi:hypothetical protein
VKGVRHLIGEDEDTASKFHGARYGGLFAERMGECVRDTVPGRVVEEEMGSASERFEKGDILSAYRFFFGEPSPGTPEGEIAGDAAWARAELRKRVGGPLNSGGSRGTSPPRGHPDWELR